MEVRSILLPHLDAEEAALSEPVLQKMMTGEQAAAVSEAASRHGQRDGDDALPPRAYRRRAEPLLDAALVRASGAD